MSLSHTFDNFKVLTGNKEALDGFKAMMTDNHKPFLLCYGRTGNGKTHLCEALSIALYQKGIRCPVTVWSEFIRYLKRLMFRPQTVPTTSYDDYFESVRRRRYLIFDDVGMGSGGTDWEFGELEDIIGYRYRERLFTVMTTNRGLEQLPERVVSRFSDPEIGVIVLNSAKDYRQR